MAEIAFDHLRPAHASSFRRLAAAHPFVAFFAIAFAGTWLLDLPIVLSSNGLGILQYSLPVAVPIPLFVLSVYAGPTLGALLVTNALEGRMGMAHLLRRYALWRVGIVWYAVVVFAYPLLYLIAASIALGGVPIADLQANWLTFFTVYVPALLVFPALITWGEEPGWRGFALTRMQQRYGPLLASVVVGLLHGIWHLPVFLMVSLPMALGPFQLTGFVLNTLGIVVITIIWTWVFNNAKESILIAVLLHASSNATGIWIGKLIPNIPSEAGYITVGVYVGLAALLLIITRGRLAYRARKPGRSD